MVVLFDGECGLCNRSVKWLIRRDKAGVLRFRPSGEVGDSVRVRFADGRELVRSEAVLACLRALPWPWPVVAMAGRMVPRGVRDWGYDAVARVRYRIWGRVESCGLLTEEDRKRFS